MDVPAQDHSKDTTSKLNFKDTTIPPREEITLQPPCEEPQIYLHALSSFCTPQTLKLIRYMKKNKVIVSIDGIKTHDFIHKRVVEETHCYVHAIPNFQIMIANGGMMKCGG